MEWQTSRENVMKNHSSLTPIKEIQLEGNIFFNKAGHGTFSLLDKNNLILAYNNTDEHLLNKHGCLAKITDNQVRGIFKSRETFHGVITDEAGNAYVTTTGDIFIDFGNDPTLLIKFNSNDECVWHHHFDGLIHGLPAFGRNFIFVAENLESDHTGYLNCIYQKTGDLVWRKNFPFGTWDEPFVIPDREEVVVGLYRSWEIFIFDFAGNVKKQMCGISTYSGGVKIFSLGRNGVVYGALNLNASASGQGLSVVAFGNKWEVLWSYKPDMKFIRHAPVVGPDGNLYLMLRDSILASLEPSGKERWNINTAGSSVYQPIVLENGQILTATQLRKPKARARTEETATHLELFSNEGQKVSEAVVNGDVIHALVNGDDIFLITCSLVRFAHAAGPSPFPPEVRWPRVWEYRFKSLARVFQFKLV
jgi:outer membrane protein assembly factor BamB